MPFGVLEDYTLPQVPGTVSLTDTYQDRDLKKVGDITLVPQPSDNPDDPLNWSPWKKHILLFVVTLTSGVTVALGPMISPGLPLLAMQFQKSLDVVSTYLVGLFILWTGIFTFFTSAAASVWGKRVIFITSGIALLALNAWGFFAKSFPQFVAMRLMQGFASAPFETLVTSTVQDIFFVHERGQKLAVWGFMITTGVLLGQVISGQMIQQLGVEYTFGICSLIFIPLVVATFFFVPETVYHRNTSTKGVELLQKTGTATTATAKSDIDITTTISTTEILRIRAGQHPAPARSPISSFGGGELAVFRGRVSDESFWRQVILPFPLFLYPAVIFGSFIYGSFFAWLVAVSVVSVPMFSAPPYNLSPAQVGLTNLPLLFAGLAGAPVSGWLADKVIRSMAKRNNGVYEPEFRLTLMAIAAVLSTVAFLGLGSSVGAGAPLAVPLFFVSCHSMAIPFASQAAYTYVTDCHPRDANQAFVTIGLVKGVLTFLSATFINGWFEVKGAKRVFWTIAAVNAALSQLTVPMYVFGKRFRALVARKIQTRISK
ncbi:hypothetical protein LTS03_003857 [Exophiala xenobiotica]|nr:hypothetical protein LTR41_000384 [Exophiala xenobiotica]KAK5227050.1 hypothetical protein LTR72_003040 [Exophiala xenobiotica]KAK5254129.1 hypothetical protein LTS06_001616 [Exophiala xenobiotica]KAK5300799.1 hypothetical protein LTR14_001197 [Exophiala xenobiotica]KAK5331373.1 hypothetical protein LTR93_000376 [Exophiala xenobiotica]